MTEEEAREILKADPPYISAAINRVAAEGFIAGIESERERTASLIKALKKAMDERILNHPNVEAGAMEDLEFEFSAYEQREKK